MKNENGDRMDYFISVKKAQLQTESMLSVGQTVFKGLKKIIQFMKIEELSKLIGADPTPLESGHLEEDEEGVTEHHITEGNQSETQRLDEDRDDEPL
jgi:hypothetical protein